MTALVTPGEQAEQVLRRRSLVPSERQAELGHQVDVLGHETVDVPDAPEVRQPIRQFLRDSWASLNFRWARESKAGLRPVFLICGLSFVATVMTEGFVVVLPDLQKDLDINPLELATALSAAMVLASLIGPVMAYYGDRTPRLRLLAPVAAIAGLAQIGSGLARSILGLVGARMVVNAGAGLTGAYSPVKPGLMSDYYPPDVRGRMFGAMGAVDSLAGIIAPAIAVALTLLFGWRTAVVLMGVPFIVMGLLLLTLREPIRGGVDREFLGIKEDIAKEDKAPGLGETLRTVAAVKTLRRFWYSQFFSGVGGVGIGLLVYYFYVSKYHAGPVLLAIVTSVNFTATMLGTLWGGGFTDRLLAYRPGRAAIIAAVVQLFSLIGYLAMSTIPFLPAVIALMVFIPFASGAVGPMQGAVLSRVIPPKVRNFGFSTLGISQLLGIPMVAIVAGLASSMGMSTAVLFFMPVAAIGAAILASCSTLVEADMRANEAALIAERASAEAKAAGVRKILICRDVDVTYEGGIQVLFNVDFDVTDGEIVALLGTNGAGKSTLLRAISGLTQASNGAIFFDGRDITHMPTAATARLGIVQVLGGRAIFPRMTVEENLRAAVWLTESDQEFVESQTARILDDFFPVLRTRLHEKAGTLSGGEQQMLALSQAFLMKPRLLMIDELSLGLSPAIVGQLLEIVRAIHAQGTTIILVEQSVNVALTVATRAVFMEKGEVRFSGPARELMERPDLLRSVFFASAGQSSASIATSHTAAVQSGIEVLRATDLHCSFGGVKALNGAHLSMRAGEIVGIIGANGAGKSTLFDAITGFAPLQQGTVTLNGRDVTEMSPDARARAGLVRSFQDARLFPTLTVQENIAIALERHGVIRSAAMAALWLPAVRRSETRLQRRADQLIELLGLGEHAEKLAGELSTGTRRVVDLACMMAADPEVLLLDEPSSGIAQAEVQSMAPLLERVRRETGCAIAVIEHDMNLITSVSDRLVAMELGSVVTEGSADDILSDPRVVAAYLGTSKEAIARSGAVPA